MLMAIYGAPDPVEAGRAALCPWQGYPWYDKDADRVARVELAPEPESACERPSTDIALPAVGMLLQGAAWLTIALLLAWMAYLLARY